jgi:hypothetical protein
MTRRENILASTHTRRGKRVESIFYGTVIEVVEDNIRVDIFGHKSTVHINGYNIPRKFIFDNKENERVTEGDEFIALHDDDNFDVYILNKKKHPYQPFRQ